MFSLKTECLGILQCTPLSSRRVKLYFLNCFVIHCCAVALREDALSVATEGLTALRVSESQMVGDD